MALEATVNSLDELVLEINGVAQALGVSNSGTCADWTGSSGSPCVVLELENWPEVAPNPACSCQEGQSIPEECKLDRHFTAFYDLLVSPPAAADRWLPFVEEGYCSCSGATGPGNPPAVRCPPPTGTPQPSAP